MTAKTRMGSLVVRIDCDGCWANGKVEAHTLEDARDAAAVEGWVWNGFRDFCPTCAVKRGLSCVGTLPPPSPPAGP